MRYEKVAEKEVPQVICYNDISKTICTCIKSRACSLEGLFAKPSKQISEI